MHCAADFSLSYWPSYLAQAEADEVLAILLTDLQWQPQRLRVYGRWVNTPRAVIWMGDADCNYTYSGVTQIPMPWHPWVKQLCDRISYRLGCGFNSVLLNLYRHGGEHMSWHRDNEACLGKQPYIASLSLGAERRFYFRHRDAHQNKLTLVLKHGSLLVMSGDTQTHYEHALPKMAKVNLPRLNLTFRQIKQGCAPATNRRRAHASDNHH